MKELKFSYNWNNKLDCKAFTTLRLSNRNKYKIGNQLKVICGNLEFVVEIISIKQMRLNQVNEFIAYIDTGYSLDEFKKLIIKMYQKIISNDTIFDFILLKKIEVENG